METIQDVAVVDPMQQQVRIDFEKTNINDQAIEALAREYTTLNIKDHTDKEGYEKVRTARIDIKKKQVLLEKRRMELWREPSRLIKVINAEAKRLDELLEVIEQHLSPQEKMYEQTNERLRVEEEERKRLRMHTRLQRLFKTGAVFFDGLSGYRLGPEGDGQAKVSVSELQKSTDEWFEMILIEFQIMGDKLRKEEVVHAENVRIEKEQKEREEAEHQRIEQAKQEELLKIQQAKLKEDARLLEERAAKVAAEEEIIRLRQEEEQKKQAEEQRLKLLEETKTDREKLFSYLDKLLEVPLPEMHHPEMAKMKEKITYLFNYLQNEARGAINKIV